MHIVKRIDSTKENGFRVSEPQKGLCRDDRGMVVRHHLHTSSVQKAVKTAVSHTKIDKPAGCHTFRHTFAALWVESSSR
jgi:integrase